MIYLKEFATQAEYDAFVESDEMNTPNVSIINEPYGVFYHKKIILPPNGVYIQDVQGEFYTNAEWESMGKSNEQANGVAVIANNNGFVIGKGKQSADIRWCSNINSLIDGVFTTEDTETAKTDYRGVTNTRYLSMVDTSGAAYYCSNCETPNGRKGYLPSIGEWDLYYNNKAAISSAISLIEGTSPGGSLRFWSSTQRSAKNAWFYWLGGGSGVSAPKDSGNITAYPFFPLI